MQVTDSPDATTASIVRVGKTCLGLLVEPIHHDAEFGRVVDDPFTVRTGEDVVDYLREWVDGRTDPRVILLKEMGWNTSIQDMLPGAFARLTPEARDRIMNTPLERSRHIEIHRTEQGWTVTPPLGIVVRTAAGDEAKDVRSFKDAHSLIEWVRDWAEGQ